MSNTIITVYADGARAIGLTDEMPRPFARLESLAGAKRNVVEAVFVGDRRGDEAELAEQGFDA